MRALSLPGGRSIDVPEASYEEAIAGLDIRRAVNPSGVRAAIDVQQATALNMTRAQIGGSRIPLTLISLAGHSAPGDGGAGAIYMRGSAAGPMAIQDAAGGWWEYVPGLTLPAGHCGLVGDGVTDDGAALEAMLSVAAGRDLRCEVPGRYYVNRPIVIPPRVRLCGTLRAVTDALAHAPALLRSTIILGPLGSISVGQGAALTDLRIIQIGAATPAVGLAEMLDKVAAFAGTAVTVIGHDATVTGCFIIGFAKGVVSSGYVRPNIRRNHIDCTHGIELTACLDVAHMRDNNCYPYYTVGQGVTDPLITQRSGKAYYIHDTADGAVIHGNFSYGWAVGMHLDDLTFAKITENSCDNSVSVSDGSVGFRSTGSMNNVLFHGNHSDSNDVNYDFAHTGGLLIGGPNTSGQAKSRQVRFGTGSAATFGQWSIAGPSSIACIEFVSGVSRINITDVYLHTSTKAGNAFVFDGSDRDKINIRKVTRSATVVTVDNLNARSDVEAIPSADQILTAGDKIVNFDTELRDAAGDFVSTAGATRFAPVTAGRYQIEIALGITPAAATPGTIDVRIYKNSVPSDFVFRIVTSSTTKQLASGIMTLDLAAGDYIQPIVNASMGATIDAARTRLRIRSIPL